MNELKFNCPHCGQSLAVDATSAGMTVACPECGQTVGVPKPEWPADGLPSREAPAKGKGWAPAAVVAVAILVIVGCALIWQRHGPAGGAGPATLPSAPAIPENLKPNLVLYFNFDSEPADGTVRDLSGHGNNGEAVNVPWTADGHRGGALVFSPTDSHIRVSNNESLNPPQFTLYAWIKTSSTGHYWRRIFDKGLFHRSFCLSIAGDWTGWNPATKYRGFLEFEMPKTPETTSRYSVADGKWHQIAATYDGHNKRLFVDGQLQAKTGRPVASLGNDLDLVVGGFTDPDPKNDDPHASFDGSLDDVMMFNRALSPEEIQALYNSQEAASD